jgi:hypothetical protein
VLFKRRHKRLGEIAVSESEAAVSAPRPPDAVVCPSLDKALEHTFRHEHPCVLTLGSTPGPTITFLAGEGGRVTVEDLSPPAEVKADDPDALPPVFKLDLADAAYDLILLWEWADFFDKKAIRELGAELARISRPGAILFLLSRSRFGGGRTDRPGMYKISGQRAIQRLPLPGIAYRRFVHTTRDLEIALSQFNVGGIHLQRDQTREILATRKA